LPPPPAPPAAQPPDDEQVSNWQDLSGFDSDLDNDELPAPPDPPSSDSHGGRRLPRVRLTAPKGGQARDRPRRRGGRFSKYDYFTWARCANAAVQCEPHACFVSCIRLVFRACCTHIFESMHRIVA
jgi:hypothetical protein